MNRYSNQNFLFTSVNPVHNAPVEFPPARETFCNLAHLQYPKSATTIPKTFRKVIADNFPQWVFSGAKVAELRHTQSEPDPARHPVLDVGYPGSSFRARMS